MEKTTQTPPDNDAAFEAIKAKIPMEESDTKPAPTVKPEEAPAPKEEEKKPEPVAPKEEKPEEKKPEPTPEPAPRAPRPQKYIPIVQYVSEKEEWKGNKAQLEARIKELEAVSNPALNQKKQDELIKKYAEKHGMDEETARAEVARVQDIIDLSAPEKEKKTDAPAPTQEKSEEEKKQQEEYQVLKSQELYRQEFTDVALPQLNQTFPNLTKEQIELAKDEIEKLASTEKYLDKPLDFIIFKERETLGKLFEAPVERKGPEATRPAQRGAPTLTPSDFKAGKTPFTALASLTAEQRDKIVNGFDGKTWDKYTHFLAQNEELEIS